jgi:hypothetical protein
MIGATMRARINIPDLAFAAFLVALGALAFALSSELTVGTAAAMGPGYVPRGLAMLIMVYGLVLGSLAMFAGWQALPGIAWRPLLLLSIAVALFAILLPIAGLALTSFALVVCAGFAAYDVRLHENALLGVVLAGFAVVLFVSVLDCYRDLARGKGRMDLFANLATGFAVALTPANLGFCFLGALIGTLVGVLPGIAPITTIAILLPFTFTLPPASSLIMLAGIFYGAQYGGSTTAILVNVPGESLRSSPVSTATRWRSRAARAPRWRSPPSHHSSPAPLRLS